MMKILWWSAVMLTVVHGIPFDSTLLAVVPDPQVNQHMVPAPVIPAVTPSVGNFDIPPHEHIVVEDTTKIKTDKPLKPDMYSMHVESHIQYRYAKTSISSRVANPASTAQEVFFSVVIPETAFISGFLMEIDGKVYQAYVKEKEEAKMVYDQAVKQGQSAAHVAVSARDSNRFAVSVNVEPQKKITFNLTYEELLTRQLGLYNHVINLNPGQLVRQLVVDVYIDESKNVTKIRVPDFKATNEIEPEQDDSVNPLAVIDKLTPRSYHVHFEPNLDEQKKLADKRKLVMKPKYSQRYPWDREGDDDAAELVDPGVGGQFIVQYEVERDPTGGEVLMNDGYFVHFFSPTQLKPLKKHVVFVLDVSGSMDGRKIKQLKEAMDMILDDMNPGDYFNIIEFSYSVTVRNLDSEVESAVYAPYLSHYSKDESPEGKNKEVPPAFPVTPEYIKKAKDIVKRMTAGGGTNIHDALRMALRVAKTGTLKSAKPTEAPKEVTKKPMVEKLKSTTEEVTKEPVTEPTTVEVPESRTEVMMADTPNPEDKPQPIIIFLTDGEPTVGETRLKKITSTVHELNDSPKISIFSLAFGEGADYQFLKRLSLVNNGFARHIYEAADASLQLKNFYRQIASPLLKDVTFVYPPDQVQSDALTRRDFHHLFQGSELVVAGRIKSDKPDIKAKVIGVTGEGVTNYIVDMDRIQKGGGEIYIPPPRSPRSPSSIERLWAYLTIKQLLDQQEVRDETGKDPQVWPDPVEEDNDEENVLKTTAKTEKQPQQPKHEPEPKEKALKIALKYSFVTPLTSLVVVKPNETRTVDSVSASPGQEHPVALPLYQDRIIGGPGLLGQPYIVKKTYAQGLSAPGAFRSFLSTTVNNRLMPTTMGFARPPPPPSFLSRPVAPQAAVPSFVAEKFDFCHDCESDTEAESTTTLPEPDVPLSLINIKWINNTTIDQKMIRVNDTDYKLGLDQDNNSFQSCDLESNLSGVCRHLHYCVSSNITDDEAVYWEQYFCVIPGNYAGICCEASITTTSASTTSTTTSAATTSTTTTSVSTTSTTSAATTSTTTTTAATVSTTAQQSSEESLEDRTTTGTVPVTTQDSSESSEEVTTVPYETTVVP